MKIELVSIPLSMNFSHDVLVIVIAQSTTEFVVIHIRLAFSFTPSTSHLIRISQFELTICAFPSDARHIIAISEEFEKKLPQLDLSTAYSRNGFKSLISIHKSALKIKFQSKERNKQISLLLDTLSCEFACCSGEEIIVIYKFRKDKSCLVIFTVSRVEKLEKASRLALSEHNFRV